MTYLINWYLIDFIKMTYLINWYLIDFIGIATHCFVAEKRLGWGPGGRAACSH